MISSVNRAHSELSNVHVACPSHSARWSDDESLMINTKRSYFFGRYGPRMLDSQNGAMSRLSWDVIYYKTLMSHERNTGFGYIVAGEVL